MLLTGIFTQSILLIPHPFLCIVVLLQYQSDSLQSFSISDIDVFEGLSSLDPSKEKGIDDIGLQILKSGALGLYAPLTLFV